MTGISVQIENGRVTVNVPNESSVGSKRSLTLASLSSASSSDDDDEARARSSSTSYSSLDTSEDDEHDKKRAKLNGQATLEKPKNKRCETCQMRDVECTYEVVSEEHAWRCDECKELDLDECVPGPVEEWETHQDKLNHRLKLVVDQLNLTRSTVESLETNLNSLEDQLDNKCDDIHDLESTLSTLEDKVEEKQEIITKLEKKVDALESSLDKRVQDIKAEFEKRFESLEKEQNKLALAGTRRGPPGSGSRPGSRTNSPHVPSKTGSNNASTSALLEPGTALNSPRSRPYQPYSRGPGGGRSSPGIQVAGTSINNNTRR